MFCCQSPLRNTTTPPTQLAQSYGGGGVIEQAVDAFFFEMDGAVASGPAAASNVGGGYAMLSHSNSYMSDVEESDSDGESNAINVPYIVIYLTGFGVFFSNRLHGQSERRLGDSAIADPSEEPQHCSEYADLDARL